MNWLLKLLSKSRPRSEASSATSCVGSSRPRPAAQPGWLRGFEPAPSDPITDEAIASAMVHATRGHCSGELGLDQRAIEEFDRAIQLKPDFAGAYYGRGCAYARLALHDRAIQDYDRAIQLQPDFADAYNVRGMAYSKLQHHQDAIRDLNTAIQLLPTEASAYNNRGAAYGALSQFKKAIQDYDKAIQLNPSYGEAYFNRGATHAALASDDFPSSAFGFWGWLAYLCFCRDTTQAATTRAICDLERAVELMPHDARPYYLRGILHIKLAQYARAIEDCTRAIECQGTHAQAFISRAIAHRYLRHDCEARADLAAAEELAANTPELLREIAQIRSYFETKRKDSHI